MFMKSFIGLLLTAIMLVSCSQEKIAYIDIDQVLNEYDGAKAAQEAMRAQSEEMAKQLDEIFAPFQQKVQEFQKNQASMSASARAAKEQELMQEQQMLQQRQQMAQQAVQAEGQKKMDEINEDIEGFLETYAQSNGYAYILGTSPQTKSIMYGPADGDITDAVIEALNAAYTPEASTPAETESTNPVN